MRFTSMGIAATAVAVIALGGCQTPAERSLEEAQAACMKQGGLLTVIYTQQVTASGIGPRVGHAGSCVPLSKFGTGSPAPAAPSAK